MKLDRKKSGEKLAMVKKLGVSQQHVNGRGIYTAYGKLTITKCSHEFACYKLKLKLILAS